MQLPIVWLAACAVVTAQPVFNVLDYGATGHKQDDARQAIQKAIDLCGQAHGGTVYLPPGEYTSGQLHLHSGVRVYLEAGASLYASLDGSHFDPNPKAALFYGEDLHDIALEGRGTVDGQASYFRKPNDFTDYYILSNQRLMEATGLPLLRSFPTGFPKETVYPRLVLLLRCTDVRITGLKFVRSRSWTINPYACKRLVIDGVYISSSQRDGVWADGIDPDGCQDVRIANSTIETGDDAIVFYSSEIWGPALPTENVTVTNCRLSSSSSAIKFCDGNSKAVRHVAINNIVITHSNRGLAFMVYDGGIVEDIVVSNVTIETPRFEWFWWGDGDPIHFNIKRRSEVDGTKKPNEPPAGIIRNVTIQNVIAHGTGASEINGHPDSWLEKVTLDNVKLFVSEDPQGAYQHTTSALMLHQARNFTMKNVEVHWEKPFSPKWQHGLTVEDVNGLLLDNVSIDGAPSVIKMNQVAGVTVRNSRVATIRLDGDRSSGIRIEQTPANITTGTKLAKGAIEQR
jgi:polygalacturonase